MIQKRKRIFVAGVQRAILGVQGAEQARDAFARELLVALRAAAESQQHVPRNLPARCGALCRLASGNGRRPARRLSGAMKVEHASGERVGVGRGGAKLLVRMLFDG